MTCTCCRGLESVEHFFLHCQFYSDPRMMPIDSVSEVISNKVQIYPWEHLSSFSFMVARALIVLLDKIIYCSKR